MSWRVHGEFDKKAYVEDTGPLGELVALIPAADDVLDGRVEG